MYQSRTAALSVFSILAIVAFFLLGAVVEGATITINPTGGVSGADEADKFCPPENATQIYNKDLGHNQVVYVNDVPYFNLYGKRCQDMEQGQVAVEGSCTAANVCKANPDDGCGGKPCELTKLPG